jgi:hypothetical protein
LTHANKWDVFVAIFVRFVIDGHASTACVRLACTETAAFGVTCVSEADGEAVGVGEGAAVGIAVGAVVGALVGVDVGDAVDVDVDAAVGAADGAVCEQSALQDDAVHERRVH